jgi:HSF-type DNA-binding
MVLSSWFRQSKYTSFQRQLSIYGFQRIIGEYSGCDNSSTVVEVASFDSVLLTPASWAAGPDRGAYYHAKFLRGQPELAGEIRRHAVKDATRAADPNFYALPFLSPSRTAVVVSHGRGGPTLTTLDAPLHHQHGRADATTRTAQAMTMLHPSPTLGADNALPGHAASPLALLAMVAEPPDNVDRRSGDLWPGRSLNPAIQRQLLTRLQTVHQPHRAGLGSLSLSMAALRSRQTRDHLHSAGLGISTLSSLPLHCALPHGTQQAVPSWRAVDLSQLTTALVPEHPRALVDTADHPSLAAVTTALLRSRWEQVSVPLLGAAAASSRHSHLDTAQATSRTPADLHDDIMAGPVPMDSATRALWRAAAAAAAHSSLHNRRPTLAQAVLDRVQFLARCRNDEHHHNDHHHNGRL